MEIKLTIPTGYHELDDSELRTIYSQIAENILSLEEMKVLFLLRVLKAKAVTSTDGIKSAVFRHEKASIEVTVSEMAVWVTDHLEWLGNIPESPCRLTYIRPDRISRKKYYPVSPLLEEISFEQYIALDNYYQGYMHTGSLHLLNEMEIILYPGITHQSSDSMDYRHLNVFYWMASFKAWAADKWSSFFGRVAPDDAHPARNLPSLRLMQRAIDTQIRALTKGDVTKEKEVLAMPCHRALTELDFLAKEAEELRIKMKKS